MITVIIKSTICLSVLLLAYLWLLENEKINHFKRWFLWFCIGFSMIIPLMNLEFITQFDFSETAIVSLQAVDLNSYAQANVAETISIFWIIYFIGFTIMFFRFITNLYQIFRVIRTNSHEKQVDYTIVLLLEPVLPHTFLNYIFLNKSDFENKNIPNEILQHEKTHAKQWHSVDIIAIEIMKIIFWFNPIFYAYKKTIQRNHEFLADEKVVAETNNISMYQTQLLVYSKPIQNYILTSNINYSLTKKRFIMMTKTVSHRKIFMKQFGFLMLFLSLTLIFNTKLVAQEKVKNATETTDSDILSVVEVKPEYPGGIQAFYQYFIDNMRVPSNIQVKGKLQMSFVVEKDGSLTDIKVVNDDNTNLGNAATTVLQKSPKWIPGMQKGKRVRIQYNLPIQIEIDR